MELAHSWYSLNAPETCHRSFAAKTAFRAGKAALGKGSEVKKLFLRAEVELALPTLDLDTW